MIAVSEWYSVNSNPTDHMSMSLISLQIPKFSLYTNETELSVSLVKSPTLGKLSKSELENARVFHEALFTKILRTAGANMRFHEAHRGYVIVPVKLLPSSQLECFLDMDMIDRVISANTTEVSPPSCSMEDLLDALVSKNYTKDRVQGTQQLYEITGFNKEEYPYSKFPNGEELTYAQYFQQKYDYEFKDYNHMQAIEYG